MFDFFYQLEREMARLKKQRRDNNIVVASRLLRIVLGEFFKALSEQLLCLFYKLVHPFTWRRKSSGEVTAKDSNDKLKMAVLIAGGMGDALMYSSVIKALSKRIGCDHIIGVVSNRKDQVDVLRFIFSGFPFVNVLEKSKFLLQRFANRKIFYDVEIGLNKVTTIMNCNHELVKLKSPWLSNFCEKNEKFKLNNKKFFEGPSVHALVNQWAILREMTRLQVADQCKLLGIDYATHTFLNLDPEGFSFLESAGLRGVKYITLQRGVGVWDKDKVELWDGDEKCSTGAVATSTRIWPERHYEKFIKLFHEAYPDVKIIQVGADQDLGIPFSGIDLNLVDQTSLQESAALLKYAIFHLDGDGGLVHMKRLLNGRSIVLLGTTPANLIGYPENINIAGPGCKSWCEWTTSEWHRKCLRGFKEAPCMASITPEMVMDGARKIIDNLKEHSYESVDCDLQEDEIGDFVGKQFQNRDIVIADIFNKSGWDLALKLRKNFSNITMFRLDFHYDSFSKAEELGLKLEYGCLYNISMADDSCDAVIWQNGDQSEMRLEYILGELFRIVKPGGLLIISGITIESATLSGFGLPSTPKKVHVLKKQLAKI
ncbi:MAG: hypothetical protein LBJ94_00485 [Puniceicoccales bacterium]|jgi:hypothetical protein|nr:hypothetical protein [Puniceicoccales bacterium]